MKTSNDQDRRAFLTSVTKAFGSAMLLSAPTASYGRNEMPGQSSWTVGQIMDRFIKEVPGAPFAQTVDTLKSGNRETNVTGIVTTMFATLEVIHKAIALRANFIIAHEPTFYNHLDDTAWLKNDEVYNYKSGLLSKHNIAVWRNHDYVHSLPKDGVYTGVASQLKWEDFQSVSSRSVFNVPNTPLQTLIEQMKKQLGIPSVRYIGDLSQRCRKILLMPGASGGRNQITAIGKEKPDVVVCGEISEWETAEYVRDARTKGDQLALVVLGHVASEEPGSLFLAQWLKRNITGIETTHVPAGNSLKFI